MEQNKKTRTKTDVGWWWWWWWRDKNNQRSSERADGASGRRGDTREPYGRTQAIISGRFSPKTVEHSGGQLPAMTERVRSMYPARNIHQDNEQQPRSPPPHKKEAHNAAPESSSESCPRTLERYWRVASPRHPPRCSRHTTLLLLLRTCRRCCSHCRARRRHRCPRARGNPTEALARPARPRTGCRSNGCPATKPSAGLRHPPGKSGKARSCPRRCCTRSRRRSRRRPQDLRTLGQHRGRNKGT